MGKWFYQRYLFSFSEKFTTVHFFHNFNDSFLDHAQNPHPNPLPKVRGLGYSRSRWADRVSPRVQDIGKWLYPRSTTLRCNAAVMLQVESKQKK